MNTAKKKPLLNFNHMMLCCRFDVWLRLLVENHFRLAPREIPQTILISLVSLLLFPFALLERFLLWLPIRRQQVKTPLFVLGHWRSGTTYLQNLLSRDPQLGYFDPVSTVSCHNSWLLRPLLTWAEKGAIAVARPMDNMKYSMDLPMEEMLAVNASSQVCIAHMLCFVERYPYYIDQAFVDELPEKSRRNWDRVYMYLLKKQTFLCKGKMLMMKSPDATCHTGEIYRLFPDAKFINIYRNPYKVIPSTINMFNKLFEAHALQAPPDPQVVEDAVIALFKRTYKKFFSDMHLIPKEQLIEVRYEDFAREPMAFMKETYEKLDIPGFPQAEAHFQAYVDSVVGYQKNKFNLRPELLARINEELGFYFDHYGYEMMQEA